ncbi:hypothetical protein E0Z10_g4954 [Xylaria hypoxylon]|uniref:SnoaL-like domain-containing protein n=1 Tax=Xylaria hypoxylon TaxID=37992 RepID=A0A4Z0Z5B5_9PEZI|nr:hypothetical protein E0Z10_g4954 [Xylaria hypoxylon]
MRFSLAWVSALMCATFPLGHAVPINDLLEDPDKLNEFARRFVPPTQIYPANETISHLETYLRVLNIQTDPDPNLMSSLVAFDATYVSLSPDNPQLHQILPWAGTRYRVGPQAFIDTFTRVGLWWTRGPFTIDAIFTDGQGNLTAWGTFDATSNTLGTHVISPWASRAVINSEGKISYFQWMEDTFATTSTFWANGTKEYCADPYGGCVWF